eukprot:NODE_15124_length_330_cov_2.081851_g13960_i0.p2 GENE.NODE_15124_length_330_cov_2.081851_g13960_i0~~NODE_15124_length_330_cov_2.081851_g13960_i0.p2  ORF type:complete len:68 (+),score=0.18 NODE_15124_length_330_cov_2.081851_g13960_i0:42-245(+)
MFAPSPGSRTKKTTIDDNKKQQEHTKTKQTILYLALFLAMGCGRSTVAKEQGQLRRHFVVYLFPPVV